jgi:tripartite-type tricarboxylate transporter receptor subunit TctC
MTPLKSRRRLLGDAAATLSVALASPFVRAQESGAGRAIRFIMPYAAGSGTDTAFRPYIESLARHFGATIYIDNKGGANGLIGMSALAKSQPDGLTIGLGTVSTMVINQFLYTRLPYDPKRDFDLIGTMVGTANLLTVRNSLGVNSIQELIALARSKPGQLKASSGGVGTTGHLSLALFNTMTQTSMVHVPYKSGADAFKDMVGGDVDLLFENVALSSQLASGGRVKMLGVTSKERVAVLPDVPTLDESGLKGYEILAWAGLVAPKGTPPKIIERMNAAMRKAVADPEVRKVTATFALIDSPGSPEDFGERIKAETPKWADLVERTGARLD